MQYKIIYDKPGRLRLRMGQCAFSPEQGYGIEFLLLSHSWILSADATHINGGILICYAPGHRDEVLELIDRLDRKNLPTAPQRDESKLKELDNAFINSVATILAKYYVMKLLVPTPLRRILAMCRAYSYWRKGFRSLCAGKLGVDVLDATAITAAMIQRDFGTASSIMMLLSLSERLEDYTKKKANQSLSQSLILNVDSVWRVEEEQDVLTPLSKVAIGDSIRIRTGGMIPLDGTITSGEALINEASLTGEALGVPRSPGQTVFAGTVVEDGAVVIQVKTLEENTRIQRIVSLIDHSEALKANIQGKAERLADSIVPYSFLASFATLLLTGSTSKALSVLMVDYSCALKLVTPICIITAMREAAERRMLVKGGKYLESFANADTIIFDKTGTLTEACPKVAKVIPLTNRSEKEILRIAACLEEHFPHSVAKAVVRQAEIENLSHKKIHADVQYIVAHGISSVLSSGEQVLIGSRHFVFEDERIPLTDAVKAVIDEQSEGYSAVYLAIGGEIAGMICVEDPVRKEAKDVLAKLRTLGIERIIMLTGDGEAAASSVCKTLGITEYYAQVLPEDKARLVRSLKEQGHTAIMVGDGINDSPALSQADVSVAMKDGSDIAKEVADITLLAESLEGLIELRLLSKSLFARIQRHYKLILSGNSLLLLLGAGGTISASTSAILHNASTMLLSGMSMRPYNQAK